jgi:Ca-activated chloride channel homolog
VEFLAPFRHPWVLIGLLVPAALLLWVWRGRGRAVVLPFDHGTQRRGSWLKLALRCAESLPPLLLAVAVLLLAGPQKWDAPRSKRVLTNIEFCVDVSGSMMSQFGEGTRYDAAMDAINAFLDFRKGDAFGLTFFGNNVLHWVPLTTDVSAFRCAPPFMRPDNLPYWFNGTEIGKALLACRQELIERQEGDRMVVLITDGFSADLYGGKDEEVAHRLKDDGIVVYTVHVAEPPVPDQMVKITAVTGGEAFAPEDKDGLKRVFARIDSMQKTKLEKTQSEATDAFAPFCLAGIGVLGGLALALFGLRSTPW